MTCYTRILCAAAVKNDFLGCYSDLYSSRINRIYFFNKVSIKLNAPNDAPQNTPFFCLDV